MIASYPFDTAQESIQPLFSVDAQHVGMREVDAGPVAQFVLILGLLFTRIQLDDFDTDLARFIERLEIEGPSSVRGAEWIMIGVCCIGAMLEFGQPDGVIKAQDGLWQHLTRSSNTQDSKRNGNVDMEDAQEDAKDLLRPMRALSTSAPVADDELPQYVMLAIRLFCALLHPMRRQPKVRVTLLYGLQYNPFLAISLTFSPWSVLPVVRDAVKYYVL
ncbi:transmembrane protein, putative, partial [Rhizoctonia solani AG-3 Rhs1AP]